MRRVIAAGFALALGGVLTGCFGGGTPVSDPTESPEVDTPVESPVAPVKSPETPPQPDEPDPHFTKSPEPAATAEAHEPAGEEHPLDATFGAMLQAIERHGEDGLAPFLANPQAGDMWRLSDWDWTRGPCIAAGPGESACVGYFTKNGTEMENIFGFENINGEWRLVESWVAWE